jgi:hypothetical protein
MNNRELAILVWLLALLVWALTKPEIRASLMGVLASALHPKIVGPLLGLAVYVVSVCVLAAGVGFWTASLIKETIIWFAISGLILFGNFTKVMQGRALLTRKALLALLAAVLVEFYMNLVVMPLWAELILQPFIAVLMMTLVVAERKPEFESAKKVLNGLLGVIGWGMVVFVTAQIISRWDEIAGVESLRELALPIWLTMAVVPIVYLIAAMAAYETAFLRIDFGKTHPRKRRRAKFALWSTFFGRIQPIGAFGGHWAKDAASTNTLRDARRVIRAYREQARG